MIVKIILMGNVSTVMKVKQVHTHKIIFTDAISKKEKSFTCSKDMLQWHLREVRKMNTNVSFERNVT